jgi:hypothetical protein
MKKNELPHTIGRQIIETETKWIPLANIHDHPISLKLTIQLLQKLPVKDIQIKSNTLLGYHSDLK